MRRSFVVAIVLLAVAFLFVGALSLLFSPSTEAVVPETESDSEPEIVTLEGSDSGFWPYLNGRQVHEKRSPINVIVRGESDEVVRLLAEHGEGNWTEPDHDHFESSDLVGVTDNETAVSTAENATAAGGNASTDGDSGTAGDAAIDGEGGNETADAVADVVRPVSPTEIPWSQADGATRYAYLDPGPGEEGYWTTETLQLEDGEYYGYRYHIRAYESPDPDDEWIVMQTHSEHFDWFTLRHRVDGVEAAQTRLERDLMAIPGVDVQEDVRRIYLGNEGPSDANGWATRVDLTAAVLLPLAVGLAARRDRRREGGDGEGGNGDDGNGEDGNSEGGDGFLERASDAVAAHLTEADRERLRAAADRLDARHLLLAATILTVILGVRIAGIALDRTVESLSVHAIAALCYPFIALGLPLGTYVIATGLERRLDAAAAASLSLAAAIWLDYALLGVDTLPIDVVVQRMLVVVALGLIAGGAARRATRDTRANGLLLVGVAMWVLVLGGTLLGYL